MNHKQALEDVFDNYYSTIDGPAIKSLHKIVMQGIRPDAGRYARHQRGIRGVKLILPYPEYIPEEMARLVKKINLTQGSLHLLEHIAHCHAYFEAIHPFGAERRIIMRRLNMHRKNLLLIWLNS